MARLTNTLRTEMAHALVTYRLLDDAKALIRTNDALRERVYNHCYSPEVQEAMGVVSRAFATNAAFASTASIAVNAGGCKITLDGCLRFRRVAVPQTHPLRYRLVGQYYRHDITDATLRDDIVAHATRLEQFEAESAQAYADALAVLNTIATPGALAKAWPEAMPVVGHLIPEGERTLPVVQVAAINAKFRLPPKDKEDKARASQLASPA